MKVEQPQTSKMTISNEQIESFNQNGYLHIPNVIRKEELSCLKRELDYLTGDKVISEARHPEDWKYGALVGDGIGEGDILCRIEYSMEKSRSFIELLGHPLILEFAAKAHQSEFVLTWEDIIIKKARQMMAVPLHQDLLYQSTKGLVFSVGVYFDDSQHDPLIAYPGTHKLGALSEDQLKEAVAERAHDLVSIPVRAGDFLIHNVLLIHGSGINSGISDRRVLYLEFRKTRDVINDSPWDEEWLDKRSRYIDIAKQIRRQNPVLMEEDSRFNSEAYDGEKAKDTYNPLLELWRVPHDPEEWAQLK